MKILFINPSLRQGSDHIFLPVGLGYVMTYVKQYGYDFDLLDIDAGDYSNEYVEEYLRKHKYDVICLGSIVTHYNWMKWCVNTIKSIQPDSKVILGNSVGGSIPEVVFQTTKVDIVIYGEGEITITKVFDAIKNDTSFGEVVEPLVEIPHANKGYPSTVRGKGIDGIIYRTKNNLIVNNGKRKAVKNIDDFPFPNWDFFDVETYLRIGGKKKVSYSSFYKQDEAIAMPINTARGCVFKCTFCHYVFWHDPYRHRSAENVILEMKQLNKKYGANFFNFWDELSFHKLGPADKFVDKLIEENLKWHWTCSIRADLMGKEVDAKGNTVPREDRLNLAKKFVKAGCVSAGYSLESGSDEILKDMNKKVESKFFKEQVNICREAGLINNTSIIIGYPRETKETIAKTMSQLEELKIYPSTGYLLPLPETGMWDYALENGFIKNIDQFLTDITERQDFSVNLTKMTKKEMEEETNKWLTRLKDKFGNPLKGLLKTGGEIENTRNQAKDKLNQEPEVNENTTDDLNYGRVSGTMR